MNALLRFTIENFRSFAERKSLVLSHAPLDENSSLLPFLRVCALYGANSSGKSNLVNALARMRYIILNSVKVNDGEDLEYEPFLLSDKKNEPTLYELEFVLSDKHYRYGFTNDSKRIVQEWLYCVNPNNSEIPLFIRLCAILSSILKRLCPSGYMFRPKNERCHARVISWLSCDSTLLFIKRLRASVQQRNCPVHQFQYPARLQPV